MDGMKAADQLTVRRKIILDHLGRLTVITRVLTNAAIVSQCVSWDFQCVSMSLLSHPAVLSKSQDQPRSSR